MRKLEALTAVTLTSGRFKLTPEQMQRRRYVVKVVDAEQRIVEPKSGIGISFKSGEIIETDAEIGKGNTALKPLDDEGTTAPNDQPPAAAPSAQPAGGTTGGEPAAAPDASAEAPSAGEATGSTAEDAAPPESGIDPLAHVDDEPPPDSGQRPSGRKRK